MGAEEFASVDALLEQVRKRAQVPSPAERVRLRTAAELSRAEVARAVGVGRQTVANWEERSSGVPNSRAWARYLHLLEGLASQYPAPAAEPSRPCVLCGGPATDEVEGFAQHLDPADCGRSSPHPPAHAHQVADGHAPAQTPATKPSTARPAPVVKPSAARRPRPRRVGQKEQNEGGQFIAGRVREALTANGGDAEAAVADLEYKAIPDAMHLLETTRIGGRYDFTHHAVLPDIFNKTPGRDSNDVWEARPKWSAPAAALPPGELKVTALDINGAYLSALKAHLPIGALEHHLGPAEGGPPYDRRRSGVHLVTPPAWPHETLPNPIGNREEPGRLWITESTLRLLHRLSSEKYGLCGAPLVHESWTSGGSEGLLEKLRVTFAQARESAL
ncbi:MAG: helix-turn-helix transcriptional regulator, partial [Streptomyces sp.]